MNYLTDVQKNIPLHLQEIILSSSDAPTSRAITRLVLEGKLHKIAPRIYTSNFEEETEVIIRRNLFNIIGKLYPSAVLSHRSALEFKPTQTGHLFLTYTYSRNVELPGVTLNFMKGEKAISGDNLISDGLFVSQRERAFLENFQPSRNAGPGSKTLTFPELEERLEQIINLEGEENLNKFRDKSKTLAQKLGMENEYNKLNKVIGALLSTKPSKVLTTPSAQARSKGNPYDTKRINLLHKFSEELQQIFANREEPNRTLKAFKNFAFYEAYFSNYIEGTKFEVAEARKIIETDTPMPSRNEDSHDILGTYHLVSSLAEMKITPENPEDLLDILRYRHKILMEARLSKNPGTFKNVNNRAGDTEFVDHKLVRGTLIKGFDYYRTLQHPFAKAAYMMFMVSEVHPFLDGNGRIARVMMNAELVNANQSRIIIPTVYREDYMGALRQLTRQSMPHAYIRMLGRAQEFSATIQGEDIDAMQSHLEKSNAFAEPHEDKLKICPFEPQTENFRQKSLKR